MDYGAKVCLPRPRCEECVVASLCAARPRFAGGETAEPVRAQGAWHGSDRMWRGRIMQVLRDLPEDRGHTTTIAALTLAIGLLAPGRWAVVVAAAAGLAIGALRVFAGAHYASDVLAGWLLGCSIMVATPALLDRLRGRLRGVATG